MSNYGHPTRVSCCEIDLLGLTKSPVTVLSVTLAKRSLQPMRPLETLIDGHMFPSDRTNIWEHSWPPEPPHASLDLLFMTEDKQIANIRVWPNRFDISKNIRSIDVFIDGAGVFSGELNESIGTVVALRCDVPEAVPSTGAHYGIGEEESDNEFPSLSFQTLEFVVVSVFDPGKELFGLRAIRLYDLNGTVTVLGQRITYDMANCENAPSPQYLFIDGPLEEQNPLFSLWKAEFKGEKPRISLRFPGPKRIAAIEIMNPRVEDEAAVNIGVKAAAICLDGHNVWAGRLASRTPDGTGSRLDRADSTFVFLIQNPEIRAMIRDFGRTHFRRTSR